MSCWYSLESSIWVLSEGSHVPGFQTFWGFLHHFVLAKLSTRHSFMNNIVGLWTDPDFTIFSFKWNWASFYTSWLVQISVRYIPLLNHSTTCIYPHVCQGFSNSLKFLHHFVFAKLCSSSIRHKKRNCLFPVTVRKKIGYRVGRSAKKFFFCIIFFVKNVCFMHVLHWLGVGKAEKTLG